MCGNRRWVGQCFMGHLFFTSTLKKAAAQAQRCTPSRHPAPSLGSPARLEHALHGRRVGGLHLG